MLACHAAALGSIPVVHERGLWRFTSCPSTLETVHLLWLAWSHKWRSLLTDIEWDIKEPLRMTSSLAVTTLSVPAHLNYIFHICAGRHGAVTMACDIGLKGLGYGSQLLWFGAVPLGKTLHLYVHSLNPGVNGYPVGQWLRVCMKLPALWWQQCCMLPRELSWYWNNRSYNQGKLMWSA